MARERGTIGSICAPYTLNGRSAACRCKHVNSASAFSQPGAWHGPGFWRPRFASICPPIQMRRKRWLRSHPASATKVAVRTQLAWRAKALLSLAMVSIVAMIVAAALVAYNYGRPSAPEDAAPLTAEIAKIRAEARQATVERDRTAALSVQLENQLKVDRAAHEQVQAQLKALENENSRLKEDLSFFESLLPTAANAKGVVQAKGADLTVLVATAKAHVTELQAVPWYFSGGDPNDLQVQLDSLGRFADEVIAQF